MRALFGVVSLLVALAIVGLLASNQLKAVKRGVGVTAPTAVPPSDTSMPPPAVTGTVRDQARQAEQQVHDDVVKALEQGAKRNQDADK